MRHLKQENYIGDQGMDQKTKKEYGKLVLSVDYDEPIRIGDDIVIVFQRRQTGRRIRVLVIAPKSMKIVRPQGVA